MNCSNCQNYIITFIKCNLCQEKLCSEECLFSHNQIFHQFSIEESHLDNSIYNNSFLNSAKEETQISSPFLVNGIINNDYIIYDPMFSPENFTLLLLPDGEPQSVGNGSFGQVFLAINNIDKKFYAIKHMDKEKLIKYLNSLEPIYAEIDIQSRVEHPNIIKLLYVKETNMTFDLVMEYAKNGTLFDYVVKNRGLSENEAFKYFIQIVNAIKFLHDNDIIHRDIKPENILIFENGLVKLCDFGWSIKCEDRLPGGSFTGTTEYMAPELINKMEYGKEIDLWMLGILLYELIHGFSPFRPKKIKFEDNEVVYNIQNHKINFYMPASDNCKELIFSLLEIDINKRCTINGIFNSKFVKYYERGENYISYSNYNYFNENDEDIENENIEINYSINSISNSNINKETQNETELMQASKSILLNRYTENDELNDSKRAISKEKKYQSVKVKKIENNIISNSQANQTEKSNIYNNNNKPNIDNIIDIDDDEANENDPNAPKNNNRNRLKNKQNINNSLSKIKTDIINNQNNLSPIKKIEEKNETNIIYNSPKNNDKKKKKKLKNELDFDFDLNPKLIVNNNLLTSRRFREKIKENIEKNEEQNIRKKMILNTDNNSKQKQKKEITNYIFNNKEVINPKQKILGKKLTLKTNSQMLSLSLSPGSFDYTILTRSISPNKPFRFPKEQKFKNNFPIDVSDNWSNNSQNVREFPFDHFASNSSLDIRKPIYNQNKNNENQNNVNNNTKNNNEDNKINKNEIKKEAEEEEIFIFKEKEPNDNMRKKKKREEIPKDNIIKTNVNKNIDPSDNKKRGGSFINNKNNSDLIQNNNYKMKTANSAIDQPVNINSLNNLNPMINSLVKNIKDNNNSSSKTTSLRNYSVSTTNDMRTKRQKSEDFNKNLSSITINDKLVKNNHNIIFSNNLKGALSPKIYKSSKQNDKIAPIKKIENKNMSFIAKNKNQIMPENSNDNNKNKNKEKKIKFSEKKRDKKSVSVYKQIRKFNNQNVNGTGNRKTGIKVMKSCQIIKKKIKEMKKDESLSDNKIEQNKENIKKIEDKDEKNIKNENNKNKKNEIKDNNKNEKNEHKENINNENKENINIVKEKENYNIENINKNSENKENIENKNINEINNENKNETEIEIKEDFKKEKIDIKNEDKENIQKNEEKKEEIKEIKNEEKIKEKKEENKEEEKIEEAKKEEKIKETKEEKINNDIKLKEEKEENIEIKKLENIEEKKEENIEIKKEENLKQKKEENIELNKDIKKTENLEIKKDKIKVEKEKEEKKDEKKDGKKDDMKL